MYFHIIYQIDLFYHSLMNVFPYSITMNYVDVYPNKINVQRKI